MELALAWVLASVAVLVLVELPSAGIVAVSAVAVVSAGFAAAYARLLRRWADARRPAPRGDRPSDV